MRTKKLKLPLFKWAGDYYPVISELKHGYKLVAHKNAPAITDGNSFFTLSIYHDDDALIKGVKKEAQEKFHIWAWEYLKPILNCPTYKNQTKR